MDKAEASEPHEAKKNSEPATTDNTMPLNETTTSTDKIASPTKSCQKHGEDGKRKAQAETSKKKAKKGSTTEEDSDSSDESSSSSSTSDSEEDTSSESESSDEEAARHKRKAKKAKAKAKLAKAKQLKKQRKAKKKSGEGGSDSDEEDSDQDAVAKIAKEANAKALLRARKQLKIQQLDDPNEIELTEDPETTRYRNVQAQIQQLQRLGNPGQLGTPGNRLPRQPTLYNPPYTEQSFGRPRRRNLVVDDMPAISLKHLNKETAVKKGKRASKVAFKRVDQLWDQSIHNFKLTETIKDTGVNEWDQYIFTVRRRFDWEHKYLETLVDIKSKSLKECLQHIMADVKGISLVQDTPHLDPNMLFLYLEECRAYQKRMKTEGETAKKKKMRKEATTKAQHLKILVKYLDKDYAETKKTLCPMLENGTITFDLLWALYKPNSIAYTSTYGDSEPRAFKIDYAVKESAFMKGAWFSIEGKYLEYDGKTFGMGTMNAEVASFQGARKISSLDCYPIQYHKDPEGIRSKLIERGKKFVALKGMNYRCHNGMAYTKRKRQVLKININGRVMVDPAIHRRINPNYPISTVKPKEDQDGANVDDTDDEDCGCEQSDSSEGERADRITPSSSEGGDDQRKKYRIVKDSNGEYRVTEIHVDEAGEFLVEKENLGSRKTELGESFSDEELIIASPVVLGFAFSEKLWLEFTVSGISDVVWNDGAFDSLVLPENQKSIVKALVSSHAFHPSRSIDDIISGKGKGLVAVLHGPPGTGKTLTAEGIADLLKCPLYMVSAGDLGTDPRTLEKELQNILDIAHSWGALLLLDEADVFLEKRSIHDIHRNALVSIFLRLLEYFQGILFLTTNRVETFDEAFVSRIHLSLRYGELNTKAKKTVWKMFIERVKAAEGMEVDGITEQDFDTLSRRSLNGRQIKNLTRAAQALAVYEGKPLSMEHIKRVIDVAQTFEMDLKGGTGYIDAMRGYT